MPLPPAAGEPHAWIALDLIPGLGSEGYRALLKAFGGPEVALEQSATSLSAIVGPKVAQSITEGPNPEHLARALRWLENEQNHLLTLADVDYPRPLLEIADPPPLLYLKGRRALLKSMGVAIVGSRNATPSGLQNSETFARALSNAGFTIISGLAHGIDAAAHRGGLDGAGSSIAVIGTGADLIYPARNKALAHEMAEKGLIISEFALGTPALGKNFPRRNRILSGLSQGVVVVEAALASGSLITARQAADQGREVFAIPGSIHSPFSKGCHQLIKQGAKLIDNVNDILEDLGKPPLQATAPTIAPENEALLTAIGFDPISIDNLLERLAMPAEQVMARLTELEIAGHIASVPGGKYQRLT